MTHGAVEITEVVTRDGLQIEEVMEDTAYKIRLIEQLMNAGVKRIEVTSFVHPQYVPQMKDAEEIFRGLSRREGVTFCALALNEKGVERAEAAGADEINYVFSVSETHNRKNSRRTVAESLSYAETLIKNCKIPVNIGLATSFGCPFEGLYPPERVLELVEKLAGYGATSITLADTTGMANPRQVKETCQLVIDRWPEIRFHLHLHNTRGMGAANLLAGLEAGVFLFDSSLGGLGGCPFAPGAAGNICTEDMVHMLHLMGYATGIDLDALLPLARDLERKLGHPLPGQVMKAGKSTDLFPSDWQPA